MMVSVGEIFGVLTHMLVSIGVKPGITWPTVLVSVGKIFRVLGQMCWFQLMEYLKLLDPTWWFQFEKYLELLTQHAGFSRRNTWSYLAQHLVSVRGIPRVTWPGFQLAKYWSSWPNMLVSVGDLPGVAWPDMLISVGEISGVLGPTCWFPLTKYLDLACWFQLADY
jgi:hypothetical protein